MTSHFPCCLDGRRIVGTVVLLTVVLGAVSVPIVSAHADLVESTPGNGEQVAQPPDELSLQYTEGIQQANVSVESADGDRVDDGVRVDPGDQSVVHVPLENVENGTYIVTWEVLSVDGHTTSGTFFFTVGDELPTREQLLSTYTTEDDDSVTAIEPVSRALLLGGLILLVGAPLTLIVAVYPLARKQNIETADIDRRARYLIGGGLLAVLLSATALAMIRMTSPQSLSLDVLRQFTTTTLGHAWLAQIGVTILLGLVTAAGVIQKQRLSKRGWLGTVVAGGLLLQASVSRTSHSAAVTNDFVGIVVDLGHLFGAALWVGGLAVMATIAPLLLKQVSDAGQIGVQLIRRFTILATAGLTVSVATGLIIASWHVPTVNSLGTTRYGTVLSIKVALVFIAIGVGGFNRFVLHPQLRTAEQRDEKPSVGQRAVMALPISGLHSASSVHETIQTFVRSVRIELIVLLLVILASGVITTVPTAANAMNQDGQANEIVFESDTDTVTVTLRVVPGQVGPNVFDVRLTQDNEQVSADEPVTILLQNSKRDTSLPQLELNQTEQGLYSTVGTIPQNGTWEIRANTWINGTYVSDSYTINVSEPTSNSQMDHSQHEQPSGDLGGFLGLGALGVAIVGYEIIRAVWP